MASDLGNGFQRRTERAHRRYGIQVFDPTDNLSVRHLEHHQIWTAAALPSPQVSTWPRKKRGGELENPPAPGWAAS